MTTGATRAPSMSKNSTSTPAPPRGRDLPTRPRRFGQWAATSLFVVVCMLAAGWLWQHNGETTEVLVVGQAVPAGQVVDRGQLSSSVVSGVDGAIPVSEVNRVVGLKAAVALVPGQVVVESMLTTQSVPEEGERLVGVELDATRAPAGLSPGDVVSVLVVPPGGDASVPSQLNQPRILAREATVYLVGKVQDGGTRLSLLVADVDANRVAAFGAAGRLALVQAPAGGGD